MIRPILTIAALTISVTVSSGELDGSAIVCKRPGIESPVMYEFKADKPLRWQVDVEGSEAVIAERDPVFAAAEYTVSPSFVKWTDPIGTKFLDRTNLELSMTTGEEEPSARVFQCRLFDSIDDFQAELEAVRALEQAEIDAQRRHNRI
jgi:hypothetical protein